MFAFNVCPGSSPPASSVLLSHNPGLWFTSKASQSTSVKLSCSSLFNCVGFLRLFSHSFGRKTLKSLHMGHWMIQYEPLKHVACIQMWWCTYYTVISNIVEPICECLTSQINQTQCFCPKHHNFEEQDMFTRNKDHDVRHTMYAVHAVCPSNLLYFEQAEAEKLWSNFWLVVSEVLGSKKKNARLLSVAAAFQSLPHAFDTLAWHLGFPLTCSEVVFICGAQT